MSTKFSKRGGTQPTPKICKAVGDSFRFVRTPFSQVLSFAARGNIDQPSISPWTMNTTSIATPIIDNHIWFGRAGSNIGSAILVTFEYDQFAASSIVSVQPVWNNTVLFTAQATISQIDPQEPFSMRELVIYESPPNDYIRVQFLY